VRNWLDHVKTLLYTLVISGIALAAIVIAAFAIPIIIGIGTVLAVYITIRILNEDSR